MKIEFEKQFGKGTDPWYAQAERWAKKQRFPISFLLLGIIDYLKKWWIDVKIYNTMKDVDRQTDELLHSWKEPERRPNIVEEGVFGDEGWSLEISNRAFGERTQVSFPKLDPRSDARKLEKDERDQGS